MENRSIWKKDVKNEALASLDKDINCDVLIIGGGIAGLLTAYFLKDSNNNIILIDKEKCAEGASSKNTGKLTFMQELVYHKLENNYSKDIAKLYLQSQKDAISLAVNIIKQNNIKCNLFEEDAYVFINKDNDKKKIEKEINFYKNNNIEYKTVNRLPNNFPIKYGIKTKGSYSFNPYKFLLEIKNIISKKIKIYENTRAIEVKKAGNYYLTKTLNKNVIKSKYVVVATQYPFFLLFHILHHLRLQ